MLKKIACTLLALSLAASFAACGGATSTATSASSGTATGASTSAAAAEPTSLTIFYHNEAMRPGMEALSEAFSQKYPNVTIVNEVVTADHVTVLKSKDAAGQLPDIFATGTYGENALKPYIDAGKIIDVSDFKVMQNLSDDYIKSLTFSDGKIYNVPFCGTSLGVIYNKKLFEQAGITETPKTFDEFKTVVETLKSKDIIPFVIAAKDVWPLGSYVFSPSLQIATPNEWVNGMYAGEESFSTYSEPAFDMLDLLRENCIEGSMEIDYMTAHALYGEEQVAMQFAATNVYKDLASMGQEVADNSGFFPIPLTNDAAKNKVVNFTDIMWQISSKANKEVVDDFFDFIVNGEGAAIFSEKLARPNPYDIPFEADAITAEGIESAANGNFYADYISMNEPEGFWQVIGTATQEYYAGMKTREETTAALDKGWKDITATKE